MARRAEPASVAIDVEACVRLLREAADYFQSAGSRTDQADGELMRALASALPGMGKDSDDAARWRQHVAENAEDRTCRNCGRPLSLHSGALTECIGYEPRPRVPR